jgi:hypothetical protein
MGQVYQHTQSLILNFVNHSTFVFACRFASKFVFLAKDQAHTSSEIKKRSLLLNILFGNCYTSVGSLALVFTTSDTGDEGTESCKIEAKRGT